METSTHLISEFPIRHFRLLGESWVGQDPLPPAPHKLWNPPLDFFIQGRPEAFALLNRLPEDGLAVVGTRRPQPRSLDQVRNQLRELQGTRLIIVSGLALGIDAAAHQAALRARLPTVAILGSPLEEVYPAENRALALEILHAGGLLVTEHAAGVPVVPHHFLLRNRLIAAWSMATWIVEAGHRSGALNTAMWARKQNRETYATPCFPGDVSLAGNEHLLTKDRAHAYWAAETLEHSWKDLFTLCGAKSRRLAGLPLFEQYNDGSDPSLLAREVKRLSTTSGGARVEEILEWSLALGWDPQRFFAALQSALDENKIEDRNGRLSA